MFKVIINILTLDWSNNVKKNITSICRKASVNHVWPNKPHAVNYISSVWNRISLFFLSLIKTETIASDTIHGFCTIAYFFLQLWTELIVMYMYLKCLVPSKELLGLK